MKNPKKSKGLKIILIISGIVVFLIGLLSVGGYLLYRYVYLPKKSKGYVSSVEANYYESKTLLKNLEEDIPKLLNLDDKNIKTEGNWKELEVVTNSKDISNNFISSISEYKDEIPSSNSLIADLDTSLHRYYDLSISIGQRYKDIVEYEEEIQPHIFTINNIDAQYQEMYEYDTEEELLTMSQKCSDWAAEYEELKSTINDIEINEDTDIKNQVIKDYLDDIVNFLNENAEITDEFIQASIVGDEYQITLLTYEYAKLELEFSDAQSEYYSGFQNYDKQMREKLLTEISSIKAKKSNIEDKMKEYK